MQLGLLAFFLVVAFHFGFSIPLPGGVFLPQVAYLGVLLVMVWRRPDPRIIFVALFGSALLLSLVILAADARVADPLRRALSGGQLIYTLTICAVVATAKPFTAPQAKRLSLIMLGTAGLIILVGLLEIFTPLAAISDAFRGVVYSKDLVYGADQRDYGLAGFIRPKAFAAEPSQAAWAICQLVLCALAFWPSRRFFLYVFGLLLLATPIFVSPNTAVTAIFLVILYVVLHAQGEQLRRSGLVFLATVILGGAIAAVFAGNFLSQRTDAYSGYEGSFYIRVVQPIDLAWLSLKHNLFIGVGYAGLEAIGNQITMIDGGIKAENLNRTPGMALLTIPVFTGLAGVALFLLLFGWVVRRHPGRLGLACGAVLIFTLLQKQSFVITSAWLVAAIWIMHLPASTAAVKRAELRPGASQVPPSDARQLGRLRQLAR